MITMDRNAASKVEYDEYVVYRRRQDLGNGGADNDGLMLGEHHVTHKINQDETPGFDMLDFAFRRNHVVDIDGAFTRQTDEDPSVWMEGRVRRVICFRQSKSLNPNEDGLTLTPQDLAVMGLHPATLQYARRVTTESRFWSADKSKLSLILSLSANPKLPYDYISMTYDINERCSTVLIRQSYHPRRHNLENLDEYDHRLEACRAHWAHPFIMPVVLLQVQFPRTEEAMAENISHVKVLEWEVSNMAGFEAFELDREKRAKMSRRLSFNSGDKGPSLGPLSMANLMKTAHDVLKESIKLLDTIRWMERAVKIMLQAGDELSERMSDTAFNHGYDRDMFSRKMFDPDRPESPVSRSSASTNHYSVPPAGSRLDDPLSAHWHEIRQYLEGMHRLCMSLETDRRMSEARCRAQIDIIYSQMAQEDNFLNARMAVASTRDSSSMKALAVITAIFLPAEFLGTLFGMNMFDWQASGEDAAGDDRISSSESGAATNPQDPMPVLSHLFWVYWAATIPLTLGILCLWRVWWVTQDRYFRRHLSTELSEEKFWTADGKPRPLERSFFYDFFYLSARRDEKIRDDASLAFSATSSQDKDDLCSPRDWTAPVQSMRQRQILFARGESIRRQKTDGAAV